MFAARDQNCELRAAVERSSDDKLALYYELRAHGDRIVFAFDGVPGKDTPYYVERAGNTLTISQKVIAPPKGLELERPEVPLAARLDPGQRLRHKLEIRLPMRESFPYPHLQPRRERGSEYLLIEARFEIGYFAAPDAGLARPAGEGWFLPGLEPRMQSILSVGPIGRVAFDPARR